MIKDEILSFAGYHWQVLDAEDGRALIITRDIIALKWYHSTFADVTWADCELRKFLNAELYDQFSEDEKKKIIAVTNANPDNPWFKTKGGNDTTDNIFLLSLEEVCRYFGDSSAGLRDKGGQTWLIDDANNARRQAKYGDDFHWWRLRSPGYYGRTSAGVNKNGCVYVRGNGVHGRPRDGGGVRPALWLKI